VGSCDYITAVVVSCNDPVNPPPGGCGIGRGRPVRRIGASSALGLASIKVASPTAVGAEKAGSSLVKRANTKELDREDPGRKVPEAAPVVVDSQIGCREGRSRHATADEERSARHRVLDDATTRYRVFSDPATAVTRRKPSWMVVEALNPSSRAALAAS
jgi:hypothetical protein